MGYKSKQKTLRRLGERHQQLIGHIPPDVFKGDSKGNSLEQMPWTSDEASWVKQQLSIYGFGIVVVTPPNPADEVKADRLTFYTREAMHRPEFGQFFQPEDLGFFDTLAVKWTTESDWFGCQVRIPGAKIADQVRFDKLNIVEAVSS